METKKIAVINSGSSSIKLTLFDFKSSERLIDVHLKGINTPPGKLEITSSKGTDEIKINNPIDIPAALELIFETLFQKFGFTISSLAGIGHRFVNGGHQFQSTHLLDKTVLKELQKLSELAPLHNEACFLGIKTCYDLDSSIPQVIVFDTSFHRTIPPVASNYALPQEIAKKYNIKRYGFHGISHHFLWKIYKEHHSENSKIITMHLGNGCSMTAIKEGSSIDTSMGFTPTEGLIMGTRCGDIDPAVMEFLYTHAKKKPAEIMDLYNFQSGLLGISELSSDMEKLLKANTENAKLAVEMFCYRILKYLGAYITVLKGIDAIIFSGGIGENAPAIREMIIQQMDWFGLKIDPSANRQAIQPAPGAIHKISAHDSSVALYVIGTDENLMIFEETMNKLRI